MYSSLDNLNKELKHCTKCPSMNNGQRRVMGVGAIMPAVFFLGESPGRLGADKTGIPFTQDRSGQLLRKMIEEIGLSSQEVYISNVLKCNPRNERGTNRRPTTEELNNCREYLLSELSIIEPKVIVPLGELASQALFQHKVNIKDIKARAYSNKLGCIFPLYHPGYIIRGNYSVTNYRQDFAQLCTLLRL